MNCYQFTIGMSMSIKQVVTRQEKYYIYYRHSTISSGIGIQQQHILGRVSKEKTLGEEGKRIMLSVWYYGPLYFYFLVTSWWSTEDVLGISFGLYFFACMCFIISNIIYRHGHSDIVHQSTKHIKESCADALLGNYFSGSWLDHSTTWGTEAS